MSGSGPRTQHGGADPGVPAGRRIGVDARPLAACAGGIAVYTREMLGQLARRAPDNDYLCLATRPEAEANLPGGRFHLCLARGPWRHWGTAWLQQAGFGWLRSQRLDAFFGPGQVLPLGLLGRVPTLVTAHDLVFQHRPETLDWRNRLTLGPVARRSFRGADRVFTPSRSVANGLIGELGVVANRVRVVHNGVAEHFAARTPDGARLAVQRELGIDRDYLLFLGTLEPRKNLQGLLDALGPLAEDGSFDGELVIAGAAGWGRAAGRLPAALGRRVRRLEHVPDAQLPDLYAGARLFVSPSLEEGFGLPVVEAMRCGTAVVCTEGACPADVVGDGAWRVPDGDVPALRAAIRTLWNAPQRRARLRELGLRQGLRFSWDPSGRALCQALAELAEGKTNRV